MDLLVALVRFFDGHQTFSGVLLVLLAILVAGPYVMLWRLDRVIREQREMYKNNVELVKQTLTLAQEHQQLVIMATTAITQVKEKVEDCPRGGVPKK